MRTDTDEIGRQREQDGGGFIINNSGAVLAVSAVSGAWGERCGVTERGRQGPASDELLSFNEWLPALFSSIGTPTSLNTQRTTTTPQRLCRILTCLSLDWVENCYFTLSLSLSPSLPPCHFISLFLSWAVKVIFSQSALPLLTGNMCLQSGWWRLTSIFLSLSLSPSLSFSPSGQYFASIMIIVGMSVIATTVVLTYHHHDPTGGTMPKWVRHLSLFHSLFFFCFSYPSNSLVSFILRLL